jgi:hypothetical protein
VLPLKDCVRLVAEAATAFWSNPGGGIRWNSAEVRPHSTAQLPDQGGAGYGAES